MAYWQLFPFRLSTTHWMIVAIATFVFLFGAVWQSPGLLGGGAAMLCLLLYRVGNGESWQAAPILAANPIPRAQRTARSKEPAVAQTNTPALETELPVVSKSTDHFVEDMLATQRYALLLRPEAKQHLTHAQVMRAIRALDEAMALVPAGRVLLGQLAEQSGSLSGAIDVDTRLLKRNLVRIDPVYLDRYCVTNEQFQQFVDAGGYEELELWPEEALPALLDFVDQSGTPGPRFWQNGRFEPGDARLPVVGVSWYEAAAYARWVGKRLPTDAEWTKAGAWPVEASPGRIAQRRYPWGESFDVRRANLYGSGDAGLIEVDQYTSGVSVGGVYQLIGNVWEWTTTPLAELGDPTLHVSESILSIRGGAFDTYFENQATCHYQSGQHPLSRRPNIGFRLTLPMSELEAPVPEPAENAGAADASSETPAVTA